MKHIASKTLGVLALFASSLAIAAQSVLGTHSGYIAAANTYDAAVDVHANTVVRTNDVAVSTRHLLWAEGATPGTTAALATATSIAIGTIDNTESSTGIAQTILMLGRGPTKKMVASEAMATINVPVYQAAGGKIALTGVLMVGYLRSVASADGSVVEVEDHRPRVAPNGSNTVAGGTLAIPVTKRYVSKTTGGVEALTLADGLPGQPLTIYLAADGGDGTLTPTTKTGFTTITFADAKDSVDLLFVDSTVGWIVTGAWGPASSPPAIA